MECPQVSYLACLLFMLCFYVNWHVNNPSYNPVANLIKALRL